MAQAYGEEIGKAMTYFTSLLRTAAVRKNLVVVETEDGTPNGYAAPGVIFLSPRAIGTQVNLKLVANEVARQWWGGLVSPATRNHHVDRKRPGALFRDPVCRTRERRRGL